MRRLQLIARAGFAVFGPALLVAMMAGRAGAAQHQPDTDTPLWRAQHGVLLGVARAGARLVAVGNDGHIILSDDNGGTWRLATSPTDELLTSVLFISPKEGWAVGQDEEIIHTKDGGETWTQQYSKQDSDRVLFTIADVGPGHLFTSGSYNLILESQDGVTWKEGAIPGLDDDYHLNCAASHGGDILVTGEAGHGFIRHGGVWTAMKLPYDGSQFACAVTPDGAFYSFGLRGTAFKALAGAGAWTKIESGTRRSIFGASLVSGNRIALVGAAGLVSLLDGVTGRVTTLPAPTDVTLSGVVEAQDGKLIIVGDDGVHRLELPHADTAEAGQ